MSLSKTHRKIDILKELLQKTNIFTANIDQKPVKPSQAASHPSQPAKAARIALPGACRWLQTSPDVSRSLQMIPAASRCF